MSHRRAWSGARAALAAVLLVPALVLLTPTAALACSCAEADTEVLLGYVDTVAVGELTAIEAPPDRADGAIDSGDLVTYTATVQTVLKGAPDNPLVFRSAAQGASCGLEGMTVGREYVFFVRDGESTLCDGTAPTTPQLVAEVEAVTGPGQVVAAPEPEPAAEPESAQDAARDSDTRQLLWPALAVVVLALLVGWLLWRRRLR